MSLTEIYSVFCNIRTVWSSVLSDIDWSVHDSPEQSEIIIIKKKHTQEMNQLFTGALIFCGTLLVKICCQ